MTPRLEMMDEKHTIIRARPKLLLLTRNLPPLLGGMERFNARVVEQLIKWCDVTVVGPLGCSHHLPHEVDVVEVPVHTLPSFILHMSISSIRVARRLRPDIIIAGSGLTAPMAKLCASCTGARPLVFLYGLDLVVSSPVYQAVWMRAIRACDGFLPISRHTRSLAIEKGLDVVRMRIITPGVDAGDAFADDKQAFRDAHHLGGRPILISVGRLTRRKGVAEFVDRSLPTIAEKYPDVILVVIGGEASEALSGSTEGVSMHIRDVAQSRGVARNILLLGSVADHIVQSAYLASDVHVFPVREIPGDVEGFGIVALEAAMHGVPTVAFSVGGVPDAVSEDVSGKLVEPDNYAEFSSAVIQFLQVPRTDADKRRCVDFAREFEWDKIGEKLRDVVSELGKL